MSARADQLSREAGTELSARYVLDEQVGFLLRQVHQRHAGIFAAAFGDITPTQWAVLAKLAEVGASSQNLLGRLVSMDVATTKGVVERLAVRGLVGTRADPDDRRRILVDLTAAGLAFHHAHVQRAAQITQETLAPLRPAERATLLALLNRMR